MKCSTSNCDNKATHDSGGMLVCGSCLLGMMQLPQPRAMGDQARADARQLIESWCANEMPPGWKLLRPGLLGVGASHGIAIAVDIKRGLIRIGRETATIAAVEAAIRSLDAGTGPAVVLALHRSLDDGDALRGVIARAIEASNSIADRDAEDAIQEMLQHLLEAEPEGHDDRFEWARLEGANAMLEAIQLAGYGARGIADNRDALRKEAARIAVEATMPRQPEPEFEAALLQREVEQLRAQLAAQRAAAHARADRQADEWRIELDRMRRELDEAKREVERLRTQLAEQRVRLDGGWNEVPSSYWRARCPVLVDDVRDAEIVDADALSVLVARGWTFGTHPVSVGGGKIVEWSDLKNPDGEPVCSLSHESIEIVFAIRREAERAGCPQHDILDEMRKAAALRISRGGA